MYHHQRRSGDLSTFNTIANNSYYINTCFFYRRIKPFINVNGEDNIHILNMESLQQNPKTVQDEIYNFLKIDKFNNIEYKIHNATSLKNSEVKFDIKTYEKLYPLFAEQQELLNNKLGIQTNWDLTQETWT